MYISPCILEYVKIAYDKWVWRIGFVFHVEQVLKAVREQKSANVRVRG